MGARQLFRGRSTLLLHGPGLRSRPAPVSRSRGHRGAESERSRSPPPRLEEGAARGVAAASSVGRDSHPRPSASARRPRGTRGRRGATTRPAASWDRVHRGAAAHFRPRDAARRPARPPHSSPSAEQRPPRPKRVPGAGHRPRGPPRLAARRVTHISAAAAAADCGGSVDLRRGQATEAEDVGGAAVTSRAGARLEPAVRSQSPRRAGSGRSRRRARPSAGWNLGADRVGGARACAEVAPARTSGRG